jgi:hypothetical protein
MLRIMTAIILSLAYAGLIITVAGVRPANGFPLWFFAPGIVAMGAALVAQSVRMALPAPWKNGETGGSPPRTVQLSWYAAFRLSGYVPVLFFPWYFLSIMGLHFDVRIGWWLFGLLVLGLVVQGVRRSARDIALLRDGAVTDALIESTDRERSDLTRVWYRFDDANGTSITGNAWRPEPVPEDGRTIPVYFDVTNARRHVIAGGSWWEAG